MSAAATLSPLLVELGAAITAGAAPAAAFADAVRRHPAALPTLLAPARSVALGAPLARAAALVADDDPLGGPLLRALAVAESCGAGAAEAVRQADHTVREEAELRRQLHVAAAQARSTLRVLAVVPAGSVALLLVVQPVTVRFYLSPLGRVTVAAAVALALLARRWARRILDRVPREAAAADPLRLACGGGAAGVAELLATALSAGLAPTAAVGLVAGLSPAPVQPILRQAVARLETGAPARDAFAAGPLAELGLALDAAMRWGAPAQAALRAYADALRADRRAALAAAAERAEVQLVFPTTLLTLPSFLLVVVPPLLWAALRA